MSSSVLLIAVLGVGLCVVGCSGGDESHTGMENTEWGELVVRREDGSGGGGGGGEKMVVVKVTAEESAQPGHCQLEMNPTPVSVETASEVT